MKTSVKPRDGLAVEEATFPISQNRVKVYCLAWLPLALSYLIVLAVFVEIDGLTLLTTWLANIVFPSLAGIGVVYFTLKEAVHKPARVQIILHTVLAVIFTTLWALILFRLLQLFSGITRNDWRPPVWPSPVMAWQLFQGLAVYLIVVSGTYAYWALEKLNRHQQQKETHPTDARIYSRTENGLIPLAISDIHAIRAVDGKSIIIMGVRTVRSRMPLSELEDLLPKTQFVRVHRTAIINLDHIHTVEPAGNGRQTVHMPNGVTIETSRAGSTALKSHLSIV